MCSTLSFVQTNHSKIILSTLSTIASESGIESRTFWKYFGKILFIYIESENHLLGPGLNILVNQNLLRSFLKTSILYNFKYRTLVNKEWQYVFYWSPDNRSNLIYITIIVIVYEFNSHMLRSTFNRNRSQAVRIEVACRAEQLTGSNVIRQS